MKIIIEEEYKNGTYESRVVEGSTTLEITEGLTISYSGLSDASHNLMDFIRALGYEGEFVVRSIKVYPAKEEGSNIETMDIPSRSRSGYHTVTYNPNSVEPDLPYECTCEHFIYRIKNQGIGGHCNHTAEARRKGLGR